MTKTTLEEAQSYISGDLVATIIIEFMSHFDMTYDMKNINLAAVGPLQCCLGYAIKNGHLKVIEGD